MSRKLRTIAGVWVLVVACAGRQPTTAVAPCACPSPLSSSKLREELPSTSLSETIRDRLDQSEESEANEDSLAPQLGSRPYATQITFRNCPPEGDRGTLN